MPRLSHRAAALRDSAIRKLDAKVRARAGVQFHRVNIGQPDIETPAPVREALSAPGPAVIAYGPASGLPELRAAAAAWHARSSPGLEARHVAVTTGGSEALLFAFVALCDPGDEIIVLEPYYTNYNGFATVAGARVVPLARHLDDGFDIPPDEVLDAAVSPRTRLLVLSNPCNPTGAVYGEATMARLLAWAARHDLFVVSDEVYRRIWFGEPPVSALSFPEHADRVVVIDSLSKTFSACGVRIGLLISRNDDLMARVEQLGQARLGPQPLAQQAALAAYTMDEGWIEATRARWQERVDVLVDGLLAIPGVSAPRPRGAFYVMARLPVADTEAFAQWMVTDFEHEGESVVLAPGPGFYADPSRGRDEVRLAAVLEPARLRRALEVLEKGLQAWAAR
jgi:aspartate aminotransferase